MCRRVPPQARLRARSWTATRSIWAAPNAGGTPPFCLLADGTPEGAAAGNVFGTYLHGLFDTGELTEKLAAWLLACKGLSAADVRAESHAAYKERQYDLLADAVRTAVDIAAVYRAMDACAAK